MPRDESRAHSENVAVHTVRMYEPRFEIYIRTCQARSVTESDYVFASIMPCGRARFEYPQIRGVTSQGDIDREQRQAAAARDRNALSNREKERERVAFLLSICFPARYSTISLNLYRARYRY